MNIGGKGSSLDKKYGNQYEYFGKHFKQKEKLKDLHIVMLLHVSRISTPNLCKV